MVIWSALAHTFETDGNLGLRCSVLRLGNSLHQKCLQLIFPLRFSFFYWFSIFSTRLITSKIPIYIQILLNSASYILGTFSSINQFFKERFYYQKCPWRQSRWPVESRLRRPTTWWGWAQLICEHNNYEAKVAVWYPSGQVHLLLTFLATSRNCKPWSAILQVHSIKFNKKNFEYLLCARHSLGTGNRAGNEKIMSLSLWCPQCHGEVDIKQLCEGLVNSKGYKCYERKIQGCSESIWWKSKLCHLKQDLEDV